MSDELNDLAAAEAKALEAERAARRAEEVSAASGRRKLFQRNSKSTPGGQSEFNRAAAAALSEIISSCQESFAEQKRRIARVEETTSAVLVMSERLHEVQRRMQELETRLEDETAPARRSVEGSRDEMRERIQSLVDEQRVCLRQLSLQTTEEAVLADRARRATELRLEELARRVEEMVRAAAA